jgi:flagellar secretion chaperone FliS
LYRQNKTPSGKIFRILQAAQADVSIRRSECRDKRTYTFSSRPIESYMDAQEAFLKQEVESASPAKLRFLLLQKAHGLSVVVQDLWKQKKFDEADQWVLRIQDIVTELLAGIVDPKHELAQITSDLYIFMSKLIAAVAIERDAEALHNVTEILEIEMETWSMFVRKEMIESQGAALVPTSYDEDGSSSYSFSA